MKFKPLAVLFTAALSFFMITSCKKGSPIKENMEPDSSAKSVIIVPNTKWLDTDGNEIKCQGGKMYLEDGIYYWVGNNFNGSDYHFAGINLYASKDLKNWKFVNTILSRTDVDSTIAWVGRPALAKKPDGSYIIMMGCDRGNGNLGYATCSTINGHYSWKGKVALLGKYEFNDHDLFTDTDGKIYFVASTVQDLSTGTWYDAVIAQCDPNTLLPSIEICKFGNGAVEGTSMFKKDGLYYFFASQKNGWNGTNTKWASSSTISGFNPSWNTYNDLSYSPATTNGFNAQNDFELQIGNNYFYMADCWSNFTSIGNGRYVWLPLSFSGGTPSLTWYDQWTLNPDGTWKP